jgi:hypothetical protein
MVAEDTVAVIGLATTVGRNPYGVGTVSDAELDARLWIAPQAGTAISPASRGARAGCLRELTPSFVPRRS